jgi:hypothetical protein
MRPSGRVRRSCAPSRPMPGRVIPSAAAASRLDDVVGHHSETRRAVRVSPG